MKRDSGKRLKRDTLGMTLRCFRIDFCNEFKGLIKCNCFRLILECIDTFLIRNLRVCIAF